MSKNTSAQPQPLKIGQAAKTLGVSIDTLRRWEGAGKISAQRTEGGTRYYSPFVKIGEAAKILGVSIDTLRRWERSGKIKAVRTPGATRLYSLEELSNLSTIPSAADFPPTTQELLERNPPSPQNEYSHFSHPAVLETLIKQKIEESLNTQIMPKKIYAKIYAGAVLSLVLVLLGTTLTVGVLNFDLIRQIGQKAEKTPAKQQEQNVLAASTIAQVGKFLEVNADTVITGNLATDGFAIFREGLTTSTLEASDSATIAGNTSIGGTTTLSSTLSVAGLSTLTGGLTTPGKLTLTGNAAETLLIKPASDPSSATKLFVIQNAAGTEKASVTSSGDASFAGKLDVTGATTLSSTLKVSGATTLSSTVTVSGATTLSSSLEVSGTTTLSGAIVGSSAGAASAPGLKLTGTWYTGGSTTTTKPQLLIEPTDTTSTAWSSSGTGLGINAKSTFTGNLIDAQLSGASKFSVDYQGNVIAANITSSGTTTFPDGSVTAPSITFTNDTNTGVYRSGTDTLDFTSGGVRTLSLPTATSGVNYVTITPAATGSGPTIAAAGSDTNIALTINSLLTGALTLDSTSTGTVNLGTSNNAKIINVGTGTGGNTINIAGTGATGADTINIGTGGTGADTITIGTTTASSSLALNDDNWNITGAGAANFVSVGATTAGSGAFTTLTSSGNSTIGTGASSVNTIGSTTTPGTLTLHGATTLDNTFSQTGTNTFGTGTGAVSLNGDTTIAANKNLALTSGTGTFTQTYSNTTGTAATWAITDSASSGTTTVKGLAVNITGTANAAGTNTITGIDFGNVAAATNNTYYGLNFGTGFNDILRYNGTQVINGSGQVVSTQISGTLFSNSSDSNSGTNTIIQGDTLTINGGTNGIDTTLSNDTYTLNLDTTEIGAATFGSGSGFTWTFDAGATDPTIAFASNQITIGSAATLTATDVTAFNCTDCIDFDDLDDTLDIDATTTINTTATTTNPLSYLADSISTGTALIISADALSTGTAMDVSSTSTAGGASGTSKLLNLARSGANANTAHTAYGIYSAVTNTNATSGTNVAGYFSASGATTNNYALYANAGSSYFATTQTVASAASATLDAFNIPASTITVSGSTNITTATGFNLVNIGQPTLSNASIAVTNAATLYIANAPTASGGGSITNPYALWVDAGDVRLDGVLQMPLGTEGAPSYTFQGDTDTGMFSTAADELALAAGGQARIKIATTGAGGLFGPLVDFLRSDGNAAVRIGINDGGGTVGVITGTSALQVGNENTSVQFGQSASQRGITTITAYGYGVSGGADFFTLTPGAHTAMTAEKSDLVVSAHTNTITGGYATQRFSLFAQPTISAATGLTVTTASTLNIAAAPTIASSAVITNAYGLQVGGATTLAGAASTTYGAIDIPAHTVTDSTTTQITSSPAVAGMRIGQITVAQSGGAVTVDNAASLYIANAPTAGASVTLTNPYALWVDAGTSAFGGNIVPDANDGAALGTTSLMWSDLFLASGSVVNFNNGDVTLTHGTDALTLAGGVFVAPLGSASAPPYTFTGDTNTGIYSSTGDSIDFSIGGSQKLQLTSSSDEFKVWGNLAFQDTISNNNGFISGSSTHNVLAFQNNGAAYGMGAFNSSNTFTSPLFNIVPWGYNVGANYTQTAEMIALQINWPAHANTPIVGGNITTQRVAYIKQPTFTGTVSERTITNSYGLFVDPATAGSLMAITNTYGIGAGASTTIAGAASSTYASLFVPAHTVTTNTTTQITSSPAVAGLSIAQITVAQSGGAVTVDNAASLYIANAPTAGASVTLTNPYALWVDAGTSAFGGNIVPDTSDGAALGTTALMWSDLFLASGSVINFNNGDVTLTHSTDTLTLAGGVFAAPLGSATAPPYTFTGDPNTGIYSSTADTVDITAAGNRVMKFASSGGNPIVPYYNIALASTSVYLTSASGHGRLTMGENGGAYAALITSQENTTHSSMLQIDPQGVDVGTDPSNLGAEMKWLELNSRTITFSANVTNQRQAHIEAATYAGSAATKTITNAYGLFVEPPITSTNAVITNTYGIGAGASTTIAGAASSTYASLFVPAHTVTTNTTTQITSSPAVAGVSIGQITVAQSGGAVTVDNAASLYIANAPTNGASVTLTNPYALWVDAGNVRFDGDIIGYDETTSANTNVITATAGGETVFNDASEDINFRIESDGDANMLHVDGGNNSIGFGRTGGATNFIALRPGNATRTAANVEGAVLYLEQDTQNFNNASSTINAQAAMSLRTQTWTNDNATLTFTNAATLYIEAAPVASTNVAISNPYALWVDAGTTRLDGTLQLGIAGATTGVMNFQGSTSGVVTLQAAATAGTYTLTLPTAQAGVNQFLKNDGSGNLSWDTSPLTLNSITAAGATNTIANANYAQTWNWGTLTTQTGMTFGGGTAMTTGSIFDLGGATYVHTAAETGELMNLTFTDASTNTTGNSITQGLNIASTINTSGAGTKNINAINIATPTKTACTSGACTWTGLAIADPGTLANTTFYAATFAGGNVGIGTTAPVAKLQVTGISSAPATSGTTTNANIRMRGAGTGLLDMGNISGGNVYLQVTDAADLSLGYNLLLNPNAGNVGIGTASPTNKLTIAGEAGIDFIESSGAYNFFALDFNNEDRTGVAFSGNDTTSAALSISSKNEMYFDIERGGAVAGIQSYIFRSNNTATTLLTIKDDGTVDVPNNIQLGDNGATSAIKVGTFGHIISRNATDGALDIGNGQATVNIGRTSANNLVVYGSGTTCTIGSGTGATNCTSDERLKTNIEAISGADALAKLSLINGVTFNWADPSRPQEQQVGIIAQDVMQAFPQIVKTGETRFMGQMGTYYTVDYAALVSPLIAGVNELNSRVNSILNDKVYDSADASLEAGDVVTVDKEASSSAYIAKSSKPYQNDLIGIVSTKPGFKLSQEDGVLENPRMVALAGRTPVKVSGEAGPIEIGDYLTSSSTPGVAMKATRPGQVVGKALEPFDSAQGGSVGKILAFVNISFADPQQALANLLLDEEGNLVIPKVKTASLEIGPIGPISQISPIGQSQEQENALDVASKLKVIDEQIATQSAYLAKAQEEIASASSELAKAKSDIDLLKLTPPEILLATGSATLANIKATETLSSEKLLTALDVTVSGVFKALGEAILPKTIVAGGLVVDGTFSVDNGSEINAIPTLYIQKNALASSLDILAGKFIFDKDGKLTVAGTVEAKQFAVSQGGAAGSGKILAGQTEVVVENEFVAENSLILITPEIPLSQTLAVTNKSNKTNTTNGKFTVKMSQPEAQDIGFSYLIIGQGQKVSSL